ncbi:D-alanyl-D-alanine carboxypeptidase family protein [Aeromicrobium sp. Leaf350]|uniref:M15 family metallopeptidase n=1 Tax=Aeromicrobium sp. Leaf350 TaxID=2876565 RepID=UPI001E3410C7|nr:M15 family metallopeptidase [Aeromicrobium sp. Leaf350]
MTTTDRRPTEGRRRRSARRPMLVLLLTALLVAVLPTASASAATRYVSPPWSGAIYAEDEAGATHLTFQQWQAAGQPAPERAGARYVKTSWSPVVWGVADIGGPDGLVQPLTAAQYATVGHPAVEVVGHAPGSQYVRHPSSPQVVVLLPDGSRRQLTDAQWREAGSPAAADADRGYYKAPWSAAIHEVTRAGAVRQIGFAEWAAAGTPTPAAPRITYARTSWSDRVWGLITWSTDPAVTTVHQSAPLTWEEYVAAGRPGVGVVGHIPGSSYVAYTSEPSAVYAITPDGARHRLTAAQHAAAGNPAVTPHPGGWVSVPWAPDIFFLNDLGAPGGQAVDAASWAAAGYPAPRSVTSIPGGEFVQYQFSSLIYHHAYGRSMRVPYAGWVAAGGPSPRIVTHPNGVPTFEGHVVPNKSFALPAWFDPGGIHPTVSASFAAMQADAARSGISLRIVSGYRSYSYQAGLYQRRVVSSSVAEADRYVARPGHSEHQTGLALDINSTSPSFAGTPEGRWLAANAHRFGFVIRYPAGKEHVTGFAYEPWHVRYLDPALATHLYVNGLTVEEYFAIPSRY